MISAKGKRKIQFRDTDSFWWINRDIDGHPRIHVISEDRSVYIEKYFDREIGIGFGYIIELLSEYFEKQELEGK